MPTTPKFGGTERLVGAVEVLRQAETHQEGDADGDVGVAGEVGVNLQRVGEQGDKVFKSREQERRVENAVHEIGGEVVAQDNLLGKSVQNPEDGDAEGAAGQKVLAVKLRNELVGANDRACDQLRKEREVETEIENVLDGRNLAAVNVDTIANRLEGEERNAYGQDDGVDEGIRAKQLVAGGGEEIVDVELDTGKVVKGVQEEVGILIVAEYKQVNNNDDDHPELLFPMLFGALNPFADKEVRNNAKYQDAHIAAARLVVEEHAGRKQEGVAEQDAVLDEGEDRKDNREESPEVELRK